MTGNETAENILQNFPSDKLSIGWWARILVAVMLTFTIPIVLVAAYERVEAALLTLRNKLKPSSTFVKSTTTMQTMFTDTEDEDDIGLKDIDFLCEDIDVPVCTLPCRMIVRTFVTLLPVALAIGVPAFSKTISLVGALGDSLLGLVFPALIYMRVCMRFGGLSVIDAILNIAMLILGLLGLAAGVITFIGP